METKTYTQTGIFSIVILVPLFIISLVYLYVGIENNTNLIPEIIMTVIMFMCLITFYRITISVTPSAVSFKMGVGIISKKYDISTIESCTALSNSLLNGIGVRVLSNGWLYNVSGTKAIELKFKNKKSIVRLGTDQPLVVCKSIEEYISGS